MTKKEILSAIRSGHMVVLRDDPASAVCQDLFGGLVIVSRRVDDVPVRQATLRDKRNATVLNP